MQQDETGMDLVENRGPIASDPLVKAAVLAEQPWSGPAVQTVCGYTTCDTGKQLCPLHIYTFARFNLVLYGTAVEFTGKVQQKPLALLKVLIALGGRNIRASRIIGLLWPDADCADSHQSFKTTLHRLRRLIGIEQAIPLQDGCLSLDQRYCWVDIWAFERLVGRLDALRSVSFADTGPEEVTHITDMALSLYSGHFLTADSGQPWALSTLERLHSKFVRIILNAGYAWEKAGVWHRAAEYYQRGLEIDDQVEEFYQRLLVCYRNLGKRSEAQLLFERCRFTLALLGLRPSPATQSAHRQAIGD